MAENRADSFLRLIRRSQRGRLKVYLGYAAGVGKTYQMLLEAHRLRTDGIDSVVGFVETHGRSETEALLAGLELIPRHKLVYRGIEIEEMDLPAILSRHHGVVLVDELAHTNVPGSRNAKRFQDVEELLAAGIHVISTLNIQHMESLYETVERTVSVKVRERVPDRMVAEADQLVNVDLTPEDLRRRLREGKVYTRESVENALDHFFRPANLEQLRELALRELAAQIDSRRRDPLAEDLPSSPDQIMVALSSRGPNSEALLRYASRLAGRLNRNWYAVYVQTSREHPAVIDAATQRLLANTLTLAQQLGATSFTYRGEDIVKTILQFAREYRVGHIVIGAPGKRVPFWRRLLGETGIVERLTAQATGITVVIHDTKTPVAALPTAEPFCPPKATNCPRVAAQERAAQEDDALANAEVLVWSRPLEMEEALRQLLDACCRDQEEWREAAWRGLQERERQGGTFVGEEVAIPHARIAGLPRPLVALGVSKTAIQDRESGQRIRIVFLLLSPLDPPESHVQMLRRISKRVRDDPWRQRALAARDPADVIALLQE